jgi:hypothetical protein
MTEEDQDCKGACRKGLMPVKAHDLTAGRDIMISIIHY